MFWEVLEEIIGKILRTLGSGLQLVRLFFLAEGHTDTHGNYSKYNYIYTYTYTTTANNYSSVYLTAMASSYSQDYGFRILYIV